NSGQIDFRYMPFVARPIGYILYFTVISLITGIAPVAYQIGQAIITSFSAVLVYKLSLELFDRRNDVKKLAYSAGLLAAIWPNEARFEITLLPDGITALVMLGFALELTRFIKSGERKYFWYIALILALSIFLRPDLVLFPAFFVLFGFWVLKPAESIKYGVLLAACLAVTIGLNTFKNYEIGGEIVPLNLGSGTTMYEG